MGRIGDSLSRKRLGGGGLFLLLLLTALLVAPLLRKRGVDHPLASRDHLDVCALVTPVLPELASLKSRAGADQCEWLDAGDKPVLSVGLSSNRSIAGGSNHGTAAMYATWIKEVVASGATEVHEQAGPWTSATAYRLGDSRQVLVDDGGLLIVLMSSQQDEATLLAQAKTLAPALRKD